MSRKSRENIVTERIQTAKRTIYKAGAYVRLSAQDKKHKGDSIETQQAIINAFIAERIDLELVEIYIDDGRTGQNTNRPAFTHMLEDMKNGKINCCVTKDLSRLGRNAIDACMHIEHYFPENNIRYIAINDGYDSNVKDSGGFMVNIMNIVNEAYALEIGRKISDTKQMNIRDGCYVGRIPPYGYLKNIENKYKLIPDGYAAPIVCHIFQMAANGTSVTEIQKWLADEEVMPPKRYFCSIGLVTEKEAQGHIRWSKGMLYSILHNRLYCGDMIQGKGRTHRYVRRKVLQSDWTITENTHEAIVSREVFAEVQKRWELAEKCETERPVRKSGNIFLRKIFCGHCGYSMRRGKSGKTQHTFSCGTRQNYGADNCLLVSMNEYELKQKLLADIKKETKIVGSKKMLALAEKKYVADNSKLHNILNEIDENERLFKSLYESYASNILESPKDYDRYKLFYSEKIENLNEQKRELMISTHNQKVQSLARSKAMAGYRLVRGISSITSEMLDELIEKILVHEDKSIKVHYKFKHTT